MRRTKRQVQKDLKLAHLPDDAFMHLLTQAGVSRARIQQIEKSENIEVATLVRFASACGYDVAITLRPIDAKKRQLTTVLAG